MPSVVRSVIRVGVAGALLLCLTLPPRPASAEWLRVTYDRIGFSALFPRTPAHTATTMTDLSAPSVVHSYVARAGDLIFAVSYGEYLPDHPFDPADELETSRDKFNAGVQARLLTSRETTYERAPGDSLPALEFTAESGPMNLLFKGRVIIDGRKAYVAVAGSPKGGDRAADADRLMKGFRLLPR